jgi:hypothetical protein
MQCGSLRRRLRSAGLKRPDSSLNLGIGIKRYGLPFAQEKRAGEWMAAPASNPGAATSPPILLHVAQKRRIRLFLAIHRA